MPTKPTIKQLQNQVSMLNDALEAALAASPETDNNFFTGGLSSMYEGRNSWDRKKIFAESMRAWRINPLARRIVKLITSFVIGKGLKPTSDDPKVQSFLDEWWNHPLNQFNSNIRRWLDEQTRTGNLFFLFNKLPDGMTIIRAVPAEQIDEIESAPNDVEQELFYWKDSTKQEKWDADQSQNPFMLHFATNKPVGAQWGEADLTPLLVWIGRYSKWLEDRVRLNQFRTAFMYVIRGQYASEADRSARERQLNANPPKSGTVLVMNANNGEDWGILSAQLDSFDATLDGTSIKKMISAGSGFPLHYLAEPESATRTTAEAAGSPTFRGLEETQNNFFEMLVSMARVALSAKGLNPNAPIYIKGPDITERDNASLALAMGRAYPQLVDMYDRELIDEQMLLELSFRMMAEAYEEKAPKGKRKPLVQPTQAPSQKSQSDPKSDPEDPKDDSSLASRLFSNFQPQNITLNVPPPEFTIENKVETPDVNIENQIQTPDINIENQIQTPSVTVQNQTPAPNVSVNVSPTPVVVKSAPAQVKIENKVEVPEHDETLVVERNEEGQATKIEKKYRKRKTND